MDLYIPACMKRDKCDGIVRSRDIFVVNKWSLHNMFSNKHVVKAVLSPYLHIVAAHSVERTALDTHASRRFLQFFKCVNVILSPRRSDVTSLFGWVCPFILLAIHWKRSNITCATVTWAVQLGSVVCRSETDVPHRVVSDSVCVCVVLWSLLDLHGFRFTNEVNKQTEVNKLSLTLNSQFWNSEFPVPQTLV